ncbi:MAG TPA: DsbA family oxidoreductase [Aliidongia sp.]|nr:DsbA family oxidoreductase [Aliidongia sp.]
MLIEIVSDLVCPWCYIGKRRLQRALAMRPDLPYRILWRVFQLNPEMPSQGIERHTYLMTKFGGPAQASRLYDAIAKTGRSEGIEFRFDRIERTPNSLQAHRLSRFAAGQGRQETMIEVLFRAYFEEGRDIGRIEVLADLAETAGLDRAAAEKFLRSDAEHAAVLAEDRMARRLGINGVPCFVIDGKYALSGAQEPEFFLPLFDLTRQDQPSPAAAE